MTERTDPWRWYCRICGAEGDTPDRDTRDAAARAHVEGEHWRDGDVLGWDEAGRLAHAWRYPAAAGRPA